MYKTKKASFLRRLTSHFSESQWTTQSDPSCHATTHTDMLLWWCYYLLLINIKNSVGARNQMVALAINQLVHQLPNGCFFTSSKKEKIAIFVFRWSEVFNIASLTKYASPETTFCLLMLPIRTFEITYMRCYFL